MTTDTRPHVLGYFRDQLRTPVTTIRAGLDAIDRFVADHRAGRGAG